MDIYIIWILGVLKDTIILENTLSEVSFLFAHTVMDLEY